MNAAGDEDKKVIAPPGRTYSAWIGGSLMGKMFRFAKICIAKDDNDEAGRKIVHTKCP